MRTLCNTKCNTKMIRYLIINSAPGAMPGVLLCSDHKQQLPDCIKSGHPIYGKTRILLELLHRDQCVISKIGVNLLRIVPPGQKQDLHWVSPSST